MTDISERQMAQMILEDLKNNKRVLDMENWGYETDCSTTACIAGHAALIANLAEYVDMDRNDQSLDFISTIDELPPRKILLMKDEKSMFDRTAAKLLGLTDSDAERLFYGTSNYSAVAALEYLAAGKDIDWDEISRLTSE